MKNVSSERTRTNRQDTRITANRQVYVDGSAARKLQPKTTRKKRQQELTYTKPFEIEEPKVQVRNSPMSLGYIIVLALAILAVGYVLIGYVRLQSDITNRINNISKLENTLNNTKLANDEAYTKIMSSIDLEQIKDIAVNELGMRYAKEGQVITYTGEGSDYVRQYRDIPDADNH